MTRPVVETLSTQDLKDELERRKDWMRRKPMVDAVHNFQELTVENAEKVVSTIILRAPMGDDNFNTLLLGLAEDVLESIYGEGFWKWIREIQPD